VRERQRRIATSRSERGQTTAEYVAITAVAVGLAVGMAWFVLRDTLGGQLTAVGDALGTFVSGILS